MPLGGKESLYITFRKNGGNPTNISPIFVFVCLCVCVYPKSSDGPEVMRAFRKKTSLYCGGRSCGSRQGWGGREWWGIGLLRYFVLFVCFPACWLELEQLWEMSNDVG